MSVEKWWNEICGRGKWEKPRERPTQTPFRPSRKPHGGTETRTRDPSGGRRAPNRLCHEVAIHIYIYIYSQIHSLHLHVGAPGIFSHLLRSVHMLKREWGAESNGKLQHLFIPSKTATLVPEFAVEDLPLSRTAALVPEFAVKDLPIGRTL